MGRAAAQVISLSELLRLATVRWCAHLCASAALPHLSACRTCLPGRISLCVTPYVAKEKTFQVTRLSTPVGMNFPESQHYMYDYVESMSRIFGEPDEYDRVELFSTSR